ncbi:MAG TPA: hypothetical protein VGJ28_10790 [Micromonosporaceae bacterium]
METTHNDRDEIIRRIARYRADPDVARREAAQRVSAYVYGNILVFAALVPLETGVVTSGRAVLIVLGVAVSTFIAHIFAELLGGAIEHDPDAEDDDDWWSRLRGSVPIVSSATVPAALLVAAWIGWIPATAATLASEIYVMVRLAFIGIVVARLSNTGSFTRTLLAGLAAAGVAAAISILKVLTTH